MCQWLGISTNENNFTGPLESFAQHAQKRVVGLVFAKDRLTRISSIEGVVNRTALISTLLSGHDRSAWNSFK